MGGNSNENIRRFHGWRGTYNNVATYALGVYKVASIAQKEFKKSVKYYIDFGVDMAKDKE